MSSMIVGPLDALIQDQAPSGGFLIDQATELQMFTQELTNSLRIALSSSTSISRAAIFPLLSLWQPCALELSPRSLLTYCTLAFMATAVDVIRFQLPERSEQCLFISNLPTSLSREELWSCLHAAFSPHGLIHKVNFGGTS